MTTIQSITLFHNSKEFIVFGPGQTVFEAGQPGDYMYAVLEGEVELIIEGNVVEVVGPDGIFGELALIDYSDRSGTARARTQCKLVPVDQMRFSFLVQHNPYFAIQVMHVMADRLRRQKPC